MVVGGCDGGGGGGCGGDGGDGGDNEWCLLALYNLPWTNGIKLSTNCCAAAWDHLLLQCKETDPSPTTLTCNKTPVAFISLVPLRIAAAMVSILIVWTGWI